MALVMGQGFLGMPGLATSASYTLGQATIPAAAAGMPPMAFPMSTLIYFQFVFAAITVIILAGSVLGRMSFTAWMIFCPVWMTLVYTVGAFSIWGGGWLAGLGVADFSGGYVIHLAAASSGFVAAALVGPRLQADRDQFPPNSLLITLVGAGILWLGWNGFNGGDPYFANADAGAAVLNTNTATAVALIVWSLMDKMAYGKPSVLGAVNGMIAGLVAITPAAGYVDGIGAIVIGVCAGIIPWLSMNKFQKLGFMKKVDDVLGVFSTHGVAAVTGGLLTGVLANPDMLVYIGTDKEAPGVSITGLLYGNPSQLLLQAEGAALHHRVQRHRDLHHPQGDQLHRPAAYGRSDAEGRRRCGPRRNRLRDRHGRRVIAPYSPSLAGFDGRSQARVRATLLSRGPT